MSSTTVFLFRLYTGAGGKPYPWRIGLCCLVSFLCFLSLSYTLCRAEDTSARFIKRLVPRYDYSLSPSGNLLLIKERSMDGGWYDNMFLRRMDEGTENVSDMPSLRFERAWWLPRRDSDELIGMRGDRLYRTDLKNNRLYVEITPTSEIAGQTIRQFPQGSAGRLIISGVGKDRSTRAIYACEVYSHSRGNCDLTQEYTTGTELYLFDHNGEPWARFHWNSERPGMGDFQIRNERSPAPYRTIYSHKPAETTFRVIRPPDLNGDLIALSNRNREFVALVRLNIYNGKEIVISEHPYDIRKVFRNNYTHEVLATSSFGDIQRIDYLNSELQQGIQKLLIHDQDRARVEFLSSDARNRRFVVRIRDARRGYITALLREDGNLTYLDSSGYGPATGDDTAYVSPEPISIREIAGPPLKGILTTPRRHRAPYPFVIMIHGGPHSQYSWDMHPLVQRLVFLGIAVFQLNYRGSSGYGREYERFILANHRPFESVRHDVALAYEWLVSNGIGRPASAGLWGDSFGTTVAVQVAGNAPKLYPAVVLLGGVFDFSSFANHLKEQFVTGQQGGIGRWSRYMGVPDTSTTSARVAELKKRGAEINPCQLAARLRSSTLIFAGKADRVAHPDQSLALHDELRARGIESRLKLLNHGHSITSRGHLVKIFTETADFFYAHLIEKKDVGRNLPGREEELHESAGYRCLTARRSIQDLFRRTSR